MYSSTPARSKARHSSPRSLTSRRRRCRAERALARHIPQPGTPASTGERTYTFTPALESAWNDQTLNLRAILPGVSEKDVNVSVQNNQLVIEGERKLPEGFDKKGWTQLAYGKFHTSVALPNGLDMEHVTCRLHNGVLEIQVPISEASKPKQIPVQTGEGRKAISS